MKTLLIYIAAFMSLGLFTAPQCHYQFNGGTLAPVEINGSRSQKIDYRGYGFKLAHKLELEGLHPYEICIVMTETGGVVPYGYNFGNLRKLNGDFHRYKSFEQGLGKFRNCISRKYKGKFTSNPQDTFAAIQPQYCPESTEWTRRCMMWYNLLYNTNN